LLLTGELTSDGAAVELVQAEVGYPVESLVPLLKYPPGFPLATYASAMGLALMKVPPEKSGGKDVAFRDVNINVLSSKYGRQSSPQLLRKVLGVSAFALVIVLLALVYRLLNEADAMTLGLQNRLNSVNRELQLARSAADGAKQLEDAITAITARTGTIREEHNTILDGRGDFAANLDLVTGLLPDGASFSHIRMGAGVITIEGEASSVFAVID
jgi:hypothetical protein